VARPVNEDRRKEKIDLILDGARSVFQRKGFLAVSMKDIIDECNISRGGLYLYFASVDEVFLAVIARRVEHRFSEVIKAKENNTDFFQLLDMYFQEQKRRLLELETSLLRATYEYLFTHQDSEDTRFQAEQTAYTTKTMTEILQLGVQQKALRNENIEAIAENFVYTIEGLSVLSLLGGLGEEDIDKQFNLMRSMLFLQSPLHANAPFPIKPLRVLVTAGDTSERIDGVRKIVNPATGRLGSLTADMFAMAQASVTYICGQNAQQPTQKMESTHIIESVEECAQTIDSILEKECFDCIVHTMAVSEYTLRRVTTAQELAADITHNLEDAKKASLEELVEKSLRARKPQRDNKRIPADIKDIVFVMDPAPNIMENMRAKQPQALLIGFLLEVDLPREQLIESAKEQIISDNCDYVLANEVGDITDSQHLAVLVAANGEVIDLSTKQEIAQMIIKCALEHEGQKA
jgi:phosphopantothenate--cysteine ligase